MSKMSEEEKKRQRLEARIGYASNVLGLTAGTAGGIAALKDERLRDGGPIARKLYRLGKHIPRGPLSNLSSKNAKIAGTLAAGAVGLQAANLAGDVVANRVLSRSVEKSMHKEFGMRNEQGISKAYVSPMTRTSGQGFNIEKADKKRSGFYDPKNPNYARNVGLTAMIPFGSTPAALVNSNNAKKGRKAAVYGRTEGRQNLEGFLGGAAGFGGALVAARKAPVKWQGRLMTGGALAGAMAGVGHGAYKATKNAQKRGDIEKAWRKEKDERASLLVPGYGFMPGTLQSRKSTRGERAVGAVGGALTGGLAGGFIGAHKNRKLAAILGGLGLVGGGALGYGGSRYKREFELDAAKKKLGVKPKLGVHPSEKDIIRELEENRRFRQQIAMERMMNRGSVSKASRRYDPEADRQRRIGLYAGLGGGTGIVLTAAGARKLKGTKLTMPKSGKTGLALLAGGAAAGGLGAAAYKRGIEIRNQPWT